MASKALGGFATFHKHSEDRHDVAVVQGEAAMDKEQYAEAVKAFERALYFGRRDTMPSPSVKSAIGVACFRLAAQFEADADTIEERMLELNRRTAAEDGERDTSPTRRRIAAEEAQQERQRWRTRRHTAEAEAKRLYEKAFRHCLRTDDGDARHLSQRAEASLRVGNWEMAERSARMAARLAPEEELIYCRVCRICLVLAPPPRGGDEEGGDGGQLTARSDASSRRLSILGGGRGSQAGSRPASAASATSGAAAAVAGLLAAGPAQGGAAAAEERRGSKKDKKKPIRTLSWSTTSSASSAGTASVLIERLRRASGPKRPGQGSAVSVPGACEGCIVGDVMEQLAQRKESAAETRAWLAHECFERERYRDAIENYSLALRLQPQSKSAAAWWDGFASSSANLATDGDRRRSENPESLLQQAEKAYGEALALKPEDTLARANRAMLRVRMQRWEEAQEDAAQAELLLHSEQNTKAMHSAVVGFFEGLRSPSFQADEVLSVVQNELRSWRNGGDGDASKKATHHSTIHE